MSGFFRRLKFAFKAFFVILFANHLPDDVAEAYCDLSAVSATSPAPPVAEPRPAAPVAAAEPSAIQVLAVLQRDGRLVDFLMEDITAYADAQIGAAVRDVHAGSRQALQRYLAIAPVLSSDEGTTVTVDAGTDPAKIKLIGNVVGQPPYRGVLRHRGWIVNRSDLPAVPASARTVIAPAEVEIA